MNELSDHLALRVLERIEEKIDRLGEELADLRLRVAALAESVDGAGPRLERIEHGREPAGHSQP